MGSLFGYKGGVILVVGNGFANNLTQYDDFDPGSLFDPTSMEPFSFVVDDFDVDWLTSGPRQGMASGFNAHMRYRESPESAEQPYDLKVNHPLKIGGTELFLIGHGYAPVITIRDGNGDLVHGGPTIFLPENANFLSFGVVRAPDAQPTQIGLEGLFYPTYLKVGDDPINVMGDLKNPTLSLQAYTGDLGMDDGSGQSVYVLDKANAKLLTKPDGSMFRVDLQVGQTVKLPDGAGTVSFDGVQRWNRIQISRTPGMHLALAGVVLSLVGLLMSLFIRPRRVWVRARRSEEDGERHRGRDRRAGPFDGGRRGGRGGRRGRRPARVVRRRDQRRGEAVTDQAWETLSNQAVAAAGLLYFLSLLSYLVQWASLRHVPVGVERKVAVGAGGLDTASESARRRTTSAAGGWR